MVLAKTFNYLTTLVLLLPLLAAAEPLSLKLYEENRGKECDKVSFHEITILKSQCGKTNFIESQTKDSNQLLEYLFFKPIAEKEEQKLSCLIDQTTSLVRSEEIRKKAVNETCKKLDLFSDALDNIALLKKNIKTYETANDRTIRNVPKYIRDKNLLVLKDLYGRLHAYETILTSIRNSDLLLGSPTIFEEVQSQFQGSMLRKKKIASEVCESLNSNVKKMLVKDAKNLIKSKSFLSSKLKESNGILDEDLKKSLWSSRSRVEHTQDLKGSETLRDSFFCRMEGLYGRGAEIKEKLMNIGSLAFGIVTAEASPLLIIKGSNSALTAGRIATYAASGFGLGVYDVVESCKDRLSSISHGNSCALDDKKNESLLYKKIDAGNCLLSASLLTVSVGTTANAIRKGLQSNLSSEISAVEELQIRKPKTDELILTIRDRLAQEKVKPTLPKDIVTNAAFFKQPIAGKKAHVVSSGGEIQEVAVLKYDQVMAKESGLSVEEVAALRTNFSDVIPDTGETGVFRLGKELVVDSNVNLIGAYSDFSKKLKTGKSLTAEDFIEARSKSYELRSIENGKDLISVPFSYKGKYSATIKSEIPGSVQERLRHYGVDVKVEKGQTTINYPELLKPPQGEQVMKQKLQLLADDVNKMVKNSYPPEHIVSFLVQDLLILHPFQNGNGRTARLMGQAMYKHLTGKDIVFPSVFHKEMENDLKNLSLSIVDPKSVPRYVSGAADFETLVRKAYVSNDILPESLKVETVVSNAPRKDVSFPKEFRGLQKERLEYDKLPSVFKENSKTLYYGRSGGQTVEEAQKQVETLFKFGRGSRDPNPHLDLNRHADSTRVENGASGFFSTTESLSIANGFANQYRSAKIGVIYVIDPKGAEVLNMHKFGNYYFSIEKEVLFGQRLNPDRIKAAVIIDSRTGNVKKIINNPLFNSQSFTNK